MSNVLTEICAIKRKAVDARKATTSVDEVARAAKAASPVRGFGAALTKSGTSHATN